MKKYISIFLVICLFASCEKEIDLDLDKAGSQIVIEGNISDQSGPYRVRITKTVGFSDPNSFPPVSGAIVTISDNEGTIDNLTETSSGIYETSIISGKSGNTYTLSVNVEGKEYSAVSTMPEKVSLDAIQFDEFNEPGETDTYSIVPLFIDPEEFGNNYRFFFKANGIADKSFQVTNDNIGNGGLNQQPFFSDDLKFYKGDNVEVTMLCIDLDTYNYYYTLSQIEESGPGGGATPSNPPNNIIGGALGIFSAYTTETKTAIIQ